MERRSRLACLASPDLSIDPFKVLPLILCESTNCWHDEILSSLRTAGWEWRVVFEKREFGCDFGSARLRDGGSGAVTEDCSEHETR